MGRPASGGPAPGGAGSFAFRPRCHRPDERKVHESPLPRVGGLAVYAAFVLPFATALGSVEEWSGVQCLDRTLVAFLVGGTCLFGLGLWDDVRGLPAEVRLVVQTLVAALAWLAGIAVTRITIPLLGVR